MSSLIIQYALIAALFVLALVYFVRRFSTAGKSDSSGCAKGCGACNLESQSE